MIETLCAPVAYCPGWKEPGGLAREALVQSTYGVVLAGGRGSRLKQLTDGCAKPAVPFAGKLKIIDFTLSNCVNSGIRPVSVLTQYKAQSLTRHIKRAWDFLNQGADPFVDVVPAPQQGSAGGYSGTANAVFQNLELLRQANARFVLVLAGDHVYKMDYRRIIADHVQRHAEVTLAGIEVPLEQASAFGVMRVDDTGRVRVFEEKPVRPSAMPGRCGVALASMGIYVFNASFLRQALQRDATDPSSGHDFGHDIIPGIISHARVFAHDYSDSCVNMIDARPYWRDVGTLDAYWEANMDQLRPSPELDLDDESWPIYGRPQSSPRAGFGFDDGGRSHLAINSLVSSDCILGGATVRHSMLFSKARIGHGSVVEDSLLLPDGIRIGVDPGHDRSRFTVSEKGVTLVTPAMLGQAMHAEA